jgi:hypothetical protein
LEAAKQESEIYRTKLDLPASSEPQEPVNMPAAKRILNGFKAKLKP